MTDTDLALPFARFGRWFEKAKECQAIMDATVMALATATPDGKPSLRIVLLKDWDERGFVFYTNYNSRKGQELQQNTQAALCFYWAPLDRQIRIEGHADPVSVGEADAYFNSRARESRIGAWASLQSSELSDPKLLTDRIAQFSALYPGEQIPRPPNWSGWRIVPQRMEFWQQGDFRLHDRDVYERFPNGWAISKLYP